MRKGAPYQHPDAKEIKPEDDTLILEVRLASGRFESSINIPLFASDAEKQKCVESWLNLMEAGINVGKTAREAKERRDLQTKDDAG